MQITLSFNSMVSLFIAMIVLAAVPSISVLTVTARSAASGFVHGAYTTFGIVTGDIFFILIAVFGLKLLAESLGSMFLLIKYLGGIWLIWLGLNLWKSSMITEQAEAIPEVSFKSSFMAGLLLTLADQKAILFYLGFFPAFLDMKEITPIDTLIILMIAIVSVGGVKLAYACVADKTRMLPVTRTGRAIKILASCFMVAVGIMLFIAAGTETLQLFN